jgi:hypothetical protein
MGTFDPSTFLDIQTKEANSTEYIPLDEGEYTGIVETVDVREWTSKKDPSKRGLALDIVWNVDDQGQREKLSRDKVLCKQGIMLDLNASGGLETGKGMNVNLGRLREAVGLNKPGEPFSFRMLVGQVARVSVKNRIDEGAIFSDIKSVTKVG